MNHENQPRRRPVSAVDRLPPFSTEAEQGVLGCVLLSPKTTMPDAITAIKSAEFFYDLRHQTIWEAMVALYDKDEHFDIITLQQFLKDRQQLEGVGGLVYLNSLPDAVPSAASLSHYAAIVYEKYVLRKSIQACSETIASAYENSGDAQEFLDRTESRILAIRRETDTKGVQTSHKDACNAALSEMQAEWENEGEITGVSTGFRDLDMMINGLLPANMIVVAARPSTGKTALSMNIAEHVAVDNRVPVGVFSLEMTQVSLIKRMICGRARVDSMAFRKKQIKQSEFPRLVHVQGEIAKAPLYIDDTSGLSILDFRARARRMVQEYGVKVIIIDYLQLLNARSMRPDSRQSEVALISSGIKETLKELNVAGIVISQLNRDMEKGGKKRTNETRKPVLSDLRESGAIEQDADVVGLLYKKHTEVMDPNVGSIGLIIAKQRNGPTGEIDFTFFKKFTRYEQAAREVVQESARNYCDD